MSGTSAGLQAELDTARQTITALAGLLFAVRDTFSSIPQDDGELREYRYRAAYIRGMTDADMTMKPDNLKRYAALLRREFRAVAPVTGDAAG